MKTHMLTRARRLFVHDGVSPSTARHNMRAWVRSIRALGDRWVYARYVGRTTA